MVAELPLSFCIHQKIQQISDVRETQAGSVPVSPKNRTHYALQSGPSNLLPASVVVFADSGVRMVGHDV